LFSSGKNAFRFLVPRQKILDNPSTSQFAEREGFMYLWYANDRRIIMYPCSNNTTMNFVATHPSEITGSKGDGESALSEHWPTGTVTDLSHVQALREDERKRVLLETFKDFGPGVLELLAMADPSELKLWPLLDMQQLSSWTKDKLALVGDAAHPFLPCKCCQVKIIARANKLHRSGPRR
jgi:2-polyprenyl-6-methoxyphenol hydroxylase-like FAD-dependent oxidoreductase